MKPTPVLITDKQRLKTAAALIREAIDDALQTAETAVQKAIRVGHLLIENKPLLGHGNFQEWIETEFPKLPYRRAARWMQAAERTVAAVGIETKLLSMPLSQVMTMQAGDLCGQDRAAQQLLFDFTRDKTIKECLAAVVVDGEEAHRITRAANGKKLGGHKGEDRKNWPQFIGAHLSDISAHLKPWKKFTPAQAETTFAKFDSAITKWPTALLTHLKDRINTELKTR